MVSFSYPEYDSEDDTYGSDAKGYNRSNAMDWSETTWQETWVDASYLEIVNSAPQSVDSSDADSESWEIIHTEATGSPSQLGAMVTGIKNQVPAHLLKPPIFNELKVIAKSVQAQSISAGKFSNKTLNAPERQFLHDFPSGYTLIETEGYNLWCGIYAIRHSIINQLPFLPPPNVREVYRTAIEGEIGDRVKSMTAPLGGDENENKNNFLSDHLAALLEAFGRQHGWPLQLGIHRPGYGDTYVIKHVEDDPLAHTLWIHNKYGYHYEGMRGSLPRGPNELSYEDHLDGIVREYGRQKRRPLKLEICLDHEGGLIFPDERDEPGISTVFVYRDNMGHYFGM